MSCGRVDESSECLCFALQRDQSVRERADLICIGIRSQEVKVTVMDILPISTCGEGKIRKDYYPVMSGSIQSLLLCA
jgi:hypothetical protein